MEKYYASENRFGEQRGEYREAKETNPVSPDIVKKREKNAEKCEIPEPVFKT